jgi:hypothetical protein
MLGAVETMRLGIPWADNRDDNAAAATPAKKPRRVNKERRELSWIKPEVGRKVSVLRRNCSLNPWQVSWLKDDTCVSAAILPR